MLSKKREHVINYIILLGILFVPLAAYFDKKFIEIIPLIYLFIYFSYLITIGKINLSFSKRFYFVIFILSIYILVSLMSYQSIASMGSISIFVLSIIFYKILNYENLKIKILVRNISYLYIILIFLIVIEMVLRLNGFESTFKENLSAVNVKGYKDYNSAALLGKLGFKTGGANSLLLGSQSASILVLSSVIWFSSVFIGDALETSRIKKAFFFWLSLVMYPFVATQTSNFIAICSFMSMIFFFCNSKLFLKRYQIFVIVLLVICFDSIKSIVMFRMKTNADISEYSEMITILPLRMFNLDFFQLVFGSGRYSMTGKGMQLSGDFGLMHIAYEAGFLLVLLSAFVLLYLTLKTLPIIRLIRHKLEDPLVSLLSINILLMLGWFVSLSHYTTAIEAGGRYIFSLHIALVLLVQNKIIKSLFLEEQIT